MRVLVTGGAGFIGSSVALGVAARHPEWELVACDNLYRRGSELNLPRLKAAGVEFEAGKSDRRFIRLRGSPNAHGAGAPPPSDTLNSTEVSDEKGDGHESSAPEDITAAELAAIAAAAEGGAA